MKEIVVSCRGTSVKQHQDEVEFALKELKKQMKKNGILNDLRRREHYLSPSKAKRRKRNESIKQRKRDQRKNEWFEKNRANGAVGDI